jgi:hypothetical protein
MLLTNKPPPCRRALLEKLTVSQLIKKLSSFCRIRSFIALFTTTRYLSLSRTRFMQSTASHLCSLRPPIFAVYALPFMQSTPSHFCSLRPPIFAVYALPFLQSTPSHLCSLRPPLPFYCFKINLYINVPSTPRYSKMAPFLRYHFRSLQRIHLSPR